MRTDSTGSPIGSEFDVEKRDRWLWAVKYHYHLLLVSQLGQPADSKHGCACGITICLRN